MTGSDRRLALWLFGALLATYWLTTGGHFYASDDLQKLALLQSLFERGTLAIPEGWSHGTANLSYSWFPLGASFLMLPGYLVGSLVAHLAPGMPAEYVLRFMVALENGVFTAALATLIFTYLRGLGRSVGGSLCAALAFGLGTMAWPYAKTAWSEPGATLLVFGGLFALQVAVRRGPAHNTGLLVTAGACLGGAALVRQELALVAVCALGWLGWQSRGQGTAMVRQLVWMAVPIGMAGGLSLWYELLRYGNALALPNYRLPQARVQPPEGRLLWSLGNLYRYTLSPNQGLIWFSPPALLGVMAWGAFRRLHRPEASLIAVTLVPLAFFYMVAWGPSSWAWGMRYGYLFLPFLVLPLAFLWDLAPARRGAITAVVAFGACVQLLGSAHDPTRLFERALAAHPGSDIQDLLVRPDTSVLALAMHATPEAIAHAVPLVTGGPEARTVAEAYRDRRVLLPDWWPFLLLVGPVPRLAVLGGALALLAACLAAWGALWRALRASA